MGLPMPECSPSARSASQTVEEVAIFRVCLCAVLFYAARTKRNVQVWPLKSSCSVPALIGAVQFWVYSCASIVSVRTLSS